MSAILWKGTLRLGHVEIPVALHPGEEPEAPDFTLLDRRDGSPVGHLRVNKRTREEVPAEEIVRGVEVEPDEFVVVTDEDFEAFDAGRARQIDVVSFVGRDEIHPVYFARPYSLEPAGDGARGYALLREVLARTRKAALARVVVRTRGRLAALLPQDSLLSLNVLRYARELRDPSELSLPGGDLAKLGVSDLEVNLCERLVEEMTEPWNPLLYRDEYREDLSRFVRHKAAVERARKAERRPAAAAGGAPGGDLIGALRRSLDTVGRRRTFLRPAPPGETASGA
jgi:DNA end-binding protein Ku